MGASAKKRRDKDEFVGKNPYCCFCGGRAASETIEHAPPSVLFIDKKRTPSREYWFPACRRCNNGTGNLDQIAALFSLGMRSSHRDDVPIEYLRKLVRGVFNNSPTVFEMLAKPMSAYDVNLRAADIVRPAKAIEVASALFEEYLNPWACKIACALWFKHTGSILPEGSTMFSHWYTNHSLMEGELPKDVVEHLQGFGQLESGKIESKDQFFYKFALGSQDGVAAFLLGIQDASLVFVGVQATSSRPTLFADGIAYRITQKNGIVAVRV